MRQHGLHLRTLLAASLLAAPCLTTLAAAQDPGAKPGPAAAKPDVGPVLAARGTITPNPARDSGVLAQVTVP